MSWAGYGRKEILLHGKVQELNDHLVYLLYRSIVIGKCAVQVVPAKQDFVKGTKDGSFAKKLFHKILQL